MMNSEIQREGGHATLVLHHSVIGSSSTIVRPDGTEYKEPVRFDHAYPVRAFKIGQPAPYAQYPQSVTIHFKLPRQRSWRGYRVLANNLTYYTIEDETGCIYDSRQDVPCDMAEFTATRRRYVQEFQDKGYTVIAAD